MIGPFRGDYRFLSNFYVEPRRQFLSNEHFYQAEKTLVIAERAAIMAAPTAGEAKRLGAEVTLRPDWDDVKLAIMLSGLRSKFYSDKTLGDLLLITGEEPLVEVNTWGDIFWGQSPYGHGENWLGRLLMEVRTELQIVRSTR